MEGTAELEIQFGIRVDAGQESPGSESDMSADLAPAGAGEDDATRRTTLSKLEEVSGDLAFLLGVGELDQLAGPKLGLAENIGPHEGGFVL